jgi:hypothetical protein
MANFFPIIILNARPASGKSEIIHYLRQVPLKERIARFHVGPIHVLDDFPMIWRWFEEDEILEHVFQLPRLHSTPEGYFLHDDLWHVLIRRLNLEFQKWSRDQGEDHTVFIEFSRGSEHGGYRAAYQHLSEEILQQAAALYVHVSYEESLRKNRKRMNVERPDSILQHSLPDRKMETLYRDDDWVDFTAQDPRDILVRGIRIPYGVMDNEDDITTTGGEALAERLTESFDRLWSHWKTKPGR